ncbi:DnaJ family domain-containing protein [Candidatus Desulfovibrio trichonymphae]|uniref:DnaJ homologue subfamily C member 28 conserved domain-containing protein n=1 Tax=Candidatus Desulfovibrio trichonymphae TaxID=1725232 RepID=A0A1J1DPL3_9BACT|nr:conserved hypothetical protein [Candidatus Desulfovibrio trichonymphae]GHV00050.1 DUF1992 domain-containing protein [Deltaproteobacteria bacterium]
MLLWKTEIEDALEKGEMDNLPGRGRPLELEDMSHIPEELRMAYKILRNAACLPPEQKEGKEISRLTEMLDQCEDEQERVHQMQKLRFMTLKAQTRYQRHILIEQEDMYYPRLLERLNSLKKN